MLRPDRCRPARYRSWRSPDSPRAWLPLPATRTPRRGWPKPGSRHVRRDSASRRDRAEWRSPRWERAGDIRHRFRGRSFSISLCGLGNVFMIRRTSSRPLNSSQKARTRTSAALRGKQDETCRKSNVFPPARSTGFAGCGKNMVGAVDHHFDGHRDAVPRQNITNILGRHRHQVQTAIEVLYEFPREIRFLPMRNNARRAVCPGSHRYRADRCTGNAHRPRLSPISLTNSGARSGYDCRNRIRGKVGGRVIALVKANRDAHPGQGPGEIPVDDRQAVIGFERSFQQECRHAIHL